MTDVRPVLPYQPPAPRPPRRPWWRLPLMILGGSLFPLVVVAVLVSGWRSMAAARQNAADREVRDIKAGIDQAKKNMKQIEKDYADGK